MSIVSSPSPVHDTPDHGARSVVPFLRWPARIAGGLVAAFFLAFLGADVIDGGTVGISVQDGIIVSSIFVMAVSLIVCWFREAVGAVMILASYTVMGVAAGDLIPAGPYLAFPFLALVFGACALLSRREPPSSVSP